MTHKGILDNFSNRFIARAIEEELLPIIFRAKCYRNLKTPEDELAYIIAQLMPRWNLMFCSATYSESYKFNAYIALASFLKKYGYKEERITKKAVESLAKFKNDAFGFQPAHQYKKVDQAIAFLNENVVYQTKKSGHTASVTQYRQGDVLAIKLGDFYVVAIVNAVENYYEAVHLITLTSSFTALPNLKVVRTESFLKDGYRVSNLNYTQDFTGQIQLLGTLDWETKSSFSSIVSHLDEYLMDVRNKLSLT